MLISTAYVINRNQPGIKLLEGGGAVSRLS